MSVVTLFDGFKNFVASIGTGWDKQQAGEYSLNNLPDASLSVIYRASWMAKKIVDIPANDATRKWREWDAEAHQIEAIKTAEQMLHLQQKVNLALQQARLFGGAALYFNIKGDDESQPLNVETVKRGSLDFITVFSKSNLAAGDIEKDPLAEGYGEPKWYEISNDLGGFTRIHRSRLALFVGSPILDGFSAAGGNQGWGDSVLQAAYEAVRNSDSIASNTGSLVYEAKVDILQIPNLPDIMADPVQREMLQNRVRLGAVMKGNNGMMVIDKEEEYTQRQYNFTGLPEIGYQALQAVSGAADIPLTRFLGQSPGGLNSSGDADLKNYYDAVNSNQSLVITPALRKLDSALLMSTLGENPSDVTYTWASLWQMSDAEKSKISKETAETINTLVGSGLFPEDALARAAINLLIEHSIMPAFEIDQDANEYEYEGPMADRMVTDAGPKTLHLTRKVLNTRQIIEWARKQGFTDITPAAEMRVTVINSTTPVDWLDLGEDWSSDAQGRLHVKPGGPREVETLSSGAKVLTFANIDLAWRHANALERGATSEQGEYVAYIAISHGEMPERVEPYQGPIVLGPETFEEVQP